MIGESVSHYRVIGKQNKMGISHQLEEANEVAGEMSVGARIVKIRSSREKMRIYFSDCFFCQEHTALSYFS